MCAKARAAAASGRAVGVAVTRFNRLGSLAWLLTAGGSAAAAVLPEDRTDVMYHYYDGGGVEVGGPALLVRKDFADQVSLSANYYADNISCASIDVLTNASPYKERRDEYGFGVDYLYRNALVSMNYTTSEEPDYLADTVNVNVAHEVFGGMTTINMGYVRGRDTVGRVDTNFSAGVSRHQYRLGVAQVLAADLLLNMDYEASSDAGYLNNPYRSARILGASVLEQYPGARTGNAVSLRATKHLSPLSALRFDYRYFWDTWQIRSNTLEVDYSRRLPGRWLLDIRGRYYTQDGASFYSDNFDTEYNYMARDKELSSFDSYTLGYKLTFFMLERPVGPFDRASLNLAVDHIWFDYRDFTDARNGDAYAFEADTVQLFLSLWY